MYTGTDLRLPLDLIRGCPLEEEDCPNYGSYVQKLKTNINKIHQSARKNIFLSSKHSKTTYDRTSRHVDFQEQKVWMYNPRRVEGRTPKLQSDWKDLIRLSRRSMMSFSASRKHQNTKRRSFILIDWQPITIDNFFCPTHGYFEPWFFPRDTGQMPGQGQRWGTTVCQLHTCVQELPTRF